MKHQQSNNYIKLANVSIHTRGVTASTLETCCGVKTPSNVACDSSNNSLRKLSKVCIEEALATLLTTSALQKIV